MKIRNICDLNLITDFDLLSSSFKGLKRFVYENKKFKKKCIDFKDKNAIIAFNNAILYFNFSSSPSFSIPLNSLCPTIPSRLNYVKWIYDLVREDDNNLGQSSFNALDIGTGASSIFPILLCEVMEEDGKVYATETNEISFKYAIDNIKNNGLSDKVEIINPNNEICLGNIFPDRNFHFTLCNPPFYENEEEIKRCRELKTPLGDDVVAVANPWEMIVPGGEKGFILSIFRESLNFPRKKNIWFSSWVGFKQNLYALEQQMKKESVSTSPLIIETVTFINGRTRRWGIAWKFDDNNK